MRSFLLIHYVYKRYNIGIICVGDTGDKGNLGEKGDIGFDGPRGIVGEKGVQGSVGNQVKYQQNYNIFSLLTHIISLLNYHEFVHQSFYYMF